MSAESAQTMPERSELVTAEHRLKELGITVAAETAGRSDLLPLWARAKRRPVRLHRRLGVLGIAARGGVGNRRPDQRLEREVP
jgi:hypothetical protein